MVNKCNNGSSFMWYNRIQVWYDTCATDCRANNVGIWRAAMWRLFLLTWWPRAHKCYFPAQTNTSTLPPRHGKRNIFIWRRKTGNRPHKFLSWITLFESYAGRMLHWRWNWTTTTNSLKRLRQSFHSRSRIQMQSQRQAIDTQMRPIFLFCVDVAVQNAYQLHHLQVKVPGAPEHSLLSFRREIAQVYVQSLSSLQDVVLYTPSRVPVDRRVLNEVRTDDLGHWIVQGTQQRCVAPGCKGTSVYACEKCNVGLHPGCFRAFHCKWLKFKLCECNVDSGILGYIFYSLVLC